MKLLIPSIRILTLGLVLGVTALSAQSCAVAGEFGKASAHAGNASGEALAAGAHSAAGSGRVASAVVAVPVWMGAAVVGGSGAVSTAIGDAATHSGKALKEGADKVWDFATGDPAQRPPMERMRAVPPLPTKLAPAKAKDPSPAEAFKRGGAT